MTTERIVITPATPPTVAHRDRSAGGNSDKSEPRITLAGPSDCPHLIPVEMVRGLPLTQTPSITSPSLCAILLSEVGCRYHAFPKGTFRAQFAPRAIPCSVLRYLQTHPTTWSWTIKAGPNAGKSFTIPSVPTLCGKDSPKVILWIVSIFHVFKSQLNTQALATETGWVLPDYVRLYQNNMLFHIKARQARQSAPPPPPASLGHVLPPQRS